ncbi:flagellar hook capping protein [Desulfobulbus propionicus DSM 2032]|jgi:flagellar basal-body rod modification protein FlgD|uniref:Basal-body rod modification protein FlgD n=1 Tax=Desulfobulbus propionicus (strain ATCC 33891 / DSM 2032 / VKM B-1956 / 1pr3) TaxID=577650 RepID=A0A7U4DPW0_DESPD|nr:flagellar hook capping FlgD N-terminal domain-containing protein [Desulfobulbus propionicus]ADW18372.1 flagellar hook capping protein [Desulfobulbus propionicus DSM 2032]
MATVEGVSSSTSTTTTATSKALGQDDFLTLLVAQLQNQDPMNPADATEFTAQLAQYSQLEQLFNLNDAMDELTSATTESQNISTLSLIGQDVVVEGAKFTLGEAPVQIGYKVDGSVSGLSIFIKNSSGKTVATLSASDLGEGNHFLTWDGKDANGKALDAGTYSMELNAKSTDTSATVTPLIRSTVTGVDLSGSEPMVVTGSGQYRVSAVYGAYDSDQGALDSSAE